MDIAHIFNGTFLFALINIMFINVILSGDNAVVIAMAVRSLPPKQRRNGIIIGTAGTVVLLISFTLIATRLLEVPFVKLLGGLLILWIAFKLLMGESEENKVKEVNGLPQAIATIMMANVVMSLDNVLGVAGASNGDPVLLIIGLAISIPVVVFASNIITQMMERFPVIVVLGAAILGRVAGEMIISDPFIAKALHHPGHLAAYSVQAILALGVVVTAKVWAKYRAPQEPVMAAVTAADPVRSPFLLENWDLT